jgi:hypothetical protein
MWVFAGVSADFGERNCGFLEPGWAREISVLLGLIGLEDKGLRSWIFPGESEHD